MIFRFQAFCFNLYIEKYCDGNKNREIYTACLTIIILMDLSIIIEEYLNVVN